MTVEQLIEKLREFPPYRVVYIGEKPVSGVQEAQSEITLFGPPSSRQSVVRVSIR